MKMSVKTDFITTTLVLATMYLYSNGIALSKYSHDDPSVQQFENLNIALERFCLQGRIHIILVL